MTCSRVEGVLVLAAFVFAGSLTVQAQAQAPQSDEPAGQHDMAHMSMPDEGWTFMQDGVLWANVNHQGGPRGGDQFVVPNWWMATASHAAGAGRLTFNVMLSLDPVSVGKDGYRELFQSGEALNGRPLVDRQHPHDLFMQLAAFWRVPVTTSTTLTLAGGPAGEPALGPVAFMHRASSADNPTAPLSHHTFDSTHISFGIVTAAAEHGPWIVEGSVFNGREPDQNRWDIDLARLDSVSGRLWFRPSAEWELQVSSGRLVSPEELEPGRNIVRSTASAAWTRINGSTISAVTAGVGRNDTDEGARLGFFVEGARHARGNTIYGRAEAVQAETAILQTGIVVDGPSAAVKDTIAAVTVGGVHDVLRWRGFEGGLGADLTVYGVPESLRPWYSSHPVSFHVFFRLRPPAGSMGRMWNMRMSQPMGGHTMSGM